MNKRGQMAIFIIVALVIIGIILAVYYYPRISPVITTEAQPMQYLQDCISPQATSTIELLAQQGLKFVDFQRHALRLFLGLLRLLSFLSHWTVPPGYLRWTGLRASGRRSGP